MPRPASSLSSRPLSSSANHHNLDIDIDTDAEIGLTAQDNNNGVAANIATGTSTDPTTNPLLRENPLLSPLEQELSDSLSHLSICPAAETLDALRLLERKTATVCTLLKASVYSIVLQQQIYNGEDGVGGSGEGHEPELGHEQQQQQQQQQQHHHYGEEGRYSGYSEGD
ncbi:DASH complex subunit DAD3 [Histoplasma capsulatum]|uniref:DASH complex subunit DAD3 n=1 Tax=Ajellomyces capsulatus TaxID=5037 RepID=A0A8A1LXV9_AJECA|nr:predicted protein [Histoplasma mississippiense (nom. inval.)]EDN02987.1 predicted protein [Histoplasma mississippiense (nom. inval.)]QSS58601.1 DASH complex subunit DAD3 [Histoplasma capsulatum]